MISSRTPEGLPNRCPVCGNAVPIEPSRPFGDVPCPHCGRLLWFFSPQPDTWFFSPEQVNEVSPRIIEIIADRLGTTREHVLANPAILGDLYEEGVDSLDLVEVIMELEQMRDFSSGGDTE